MKSRFRKNKKQKYSHPQLVPKEFLGAFKVGHRASTKEFIDDEFSLSLLKKIIDSNYKDYNAIFELAFLTSFNNEFHRNVIKKGDEAALHHTDELRKDLYRRENSKNRDIMSIERSKIELVEEIGEWTPDPQNNPEDEWIDQIDQIDQYE